ncbi:MFS transporter [Streptomyces longwoodensis]|uniref:MFS transporter n=1 Tax=Streptomyces longwoodensis TaxID=68231 RepID=UPI0033FB08F8
MAQESPPHGVHPSAGHHHEGQGPPVPRRWATLALLCMAQFLLIVDVTVINVALPAVGDALDLSAGQLTWAVTAYTLCFGSLLLLGGRAGDHFGRKRTFLAGLLIFTAASLMSGLSDGGGTLIAARAAQGVGAALLSPAAMAIITSMFDGPERHRALGVWAAIGGSGAAFGVLLGGLLTTSLGWEWIFFINIPIGAVVFLCVGVLVKEREEPHPGHHQQAPKGVDPAGALTMTAAPGLLIYGLVQAREHGFGSASVLVPLLGAVLCAGVFIAVERSVRLPLVRLSVLARRNLVGGSLVMLAASGVLISLFFLCSLYLQHVLGLSAMRTGLVFLPVAVAITLGAHVGSKVIGRIGWRPAAIAGFALAAVGGLLLARVGDSGSAWTQVLPGFLVAAVGLGLGFVCATTSAMADVPHQDMGLTSGLVNTFHELGSALGVAVMAAVAGASLDTAGSAVPPTSGFSRAFVACAVISLITAAAAALLLPRGRPDPSQGPVFAH